MNPNKDEQVAKTVKIFDLQVEQQMLPKGSNPVGRGNLLKNSERGLSIEDVPRLLLGHVELQEHVLERGTDAEMEKIARHQPFNPPIQHVDVGSRKDFAFTSESNSIKRNWEELVKAKNKAKFNPRTLVIVRNELDNLVKKSEGIDESIASSGNSTSTWASFAPIPEEAPIEKIIPGFSEMSDEDKVDALKDELPPFDENDVKYANLKFALG